MLSSVQETTTSTWLTNFRLLVADCLSGRRIMTPLSRHGHIYLSIVNDTVEITKPEPTMSHGRVFRLRIVKKMHILKRKLPNLRLYTHIHVTACRQDTSAK